jgi:hypothetical protein
VEVVKIEGLLSRTDPWRLYIYALKSPQTREKYVLRLGKFLDCINLQGSIEEKAREFAKKGKDNSEWAFDTILNFIIGLKDRFDKKELAAGTIRNYVKSIKLFCTMSDIQIPWDKITRGLPKGKRYAEDRAPTFEEIKILLNYPDRRIKSIISVMISSRIRVGAWDYLKWGNLIPVEKDGQIVAAKVIVYTGEDDCYLSFTTPSAYNEVLSWMRYRETCGENITEESWVMRDLWDTNAAISKGLVTCPKQLQSVGIRRLMERALRAQGLRTRKMENGKKRYPFSETHSFRKYFKTQCELPGMKPINIEHLMGHSTGISDSYYRPTENQLLEDYLKTVNVLTINDKLLYDKQISALTEKYTIENYVTKGKLEEKEKEILILKQHELMNSDAIASLSDQIAILASDIARLKKL